MPLNCLSHNFSAFFLSALKESTWPAAQQQCSFPLSGICLKMNSAKINKFRKTKSILNDRYGQSSFDNRSSSATATIWVKFAQALRQRMLTKKFQIFF